MKFVYIIMILLVAIAAVIFALQNSAAITVSFFSWSLTGSLSLFLIITLTIGFIVAMLLMAPSLCKRGWLTSGLKRKVAVLEKEKAKQGEKDAVTAAATDAAIVASEAASKAHEDKTAVTTENRNTGND
jgi:putative membrane protein